jgi:hypothetical protein
MSLSSRLTTVLALLYRQRQQLGAYAWMPRLPTGLRSGEASTVTDIARHRADRLRVMNAIYEAAEGSRMSHVSGGWLLEHLELSDEELGGICRYLEGEHLITAGQEH